MELWAFQRHRQVLGYFEEFEVLPEGSEGASDGSDGFKAISREFKANP